MRLFSDVVCTIEDPFLRRAAELAVQAVGRTAPNPMVGCVVVAGGRIVGEGFHARAGGPHAEIAALEEAGPAAAGADVYVTLEPCAHQGRTPPCSDALLRAGVRRVVIGMPDPTPLAQGGANILAAAGAEVSFADDSSPFEEINESWLTRVRTGRPRVLAKVATSLDGRVASAPGARTDITGSDGAWVTHRLRAAVDAVMVGAATLIADDPALTVRDEGGTDRDRQPLRVVLVRDRVPAPHARVFTDGAGPVLVLASDGARREGLRGLSDADIAFYPHERGVSGALELLGERGINSVLVEPGPTLLSALWGAELIDELITVTAGGMCGPDSLPAFTGATDVTDGALMHVVRPLESGIVGDVSVTRWEKSHPAAGSI